MSRLSIIHRIGDLTEQKCKGCEERKELIRLQPPGVTSPVDKHCSQVCPIGVELGQLGDQLLQISSAKRKTNKEKERIEEQMVAEARKRGPAPKEAPSSGLTKEIYIERIAAGVKNASIEREWKMKQNSVYEWINRWGLKGLTVERARELMCAPLLRSTSPVAQLAEVKAAEVKPKKETTGLKELNAEREAEQIKALSAKLRDRNATVDKLLLENKRLHEVVDSYESEIASMINRGNEKDLQFKELEEERNRLLEALQVEVEDGIDAMFEDMPATKGEVECVDAIEAAITGLSGMQAYITGNVIDYLWRWQEKDGVERLKMARMLIDRMIASAETVVEVNK